MGYLLDNLPQRKEQIVECPALYKLILRVIRRPPREAQAAAESDISVSLIVKSVISDVEEWQYTGSQPEFFEFRFHLEADRNRAEAELNFFGHPTERDQER